VKRLTALLIVLLIVAGCGEGQDSTAAQEEATRELQQAQEDLRKERRKLKRESRKASREAQEPSDDGSSSRADDTDVEEGRVPRVKGKDLQFAQDTMQAAGFYNLSEEDASGEDRIPLWDRGWTVVSQSPKPGTEASTDRTIILRVKRDDE
jgi:beta-lactam-binding protein with PASTA domain